MPPQRASVENPIQKLLEEPLRFVCGWGGSVSGYFPMHHHPVIELVYHPQGSGITTLSDGRRITFEPHGTVIYPALVRHEQRMNELGKDICIHVAAPSPDLFPEALYIPPGNAGDRRGDRYVRSEFLQLSQVRLDAGRRVELDLRVTALVARLLQLNRLVAEEAPQASSELHLERARRFIRENYARISCVEEIAAHVGVSEDYLRHLFAERGGTSLNRLLGQTRIERAKELLIHSRLPIKEIASLSGFKTERYLSTCFKRESRVSPGAFRRKFSGVA